MTTRLHELQSGAGSQIGAQDLAILARPSATVFLQGTTVSAAASDQSFNDSANGFLTAGFANGDSVVVTGFVNGVNNLFTGRITSAAAGKLIISASGSPIINESAGATVRISKWVTRRETLSTLLARHLHFAASGEAVPLVVGTNLIRLRSPQALTVTQVRASLSTAQTSGSILTVDINVAGTSMLSTKLTFDNTSKTTVGAAAPAVISNPSIADDAEISVDIDQVGDGTAAGLKILITGY